MMEVVQHYKGRLVRANQHIIMHVKNDIPLSKGLGSSAAAVIAGCILLTASKIDHDHHDHHIQLQKETKF